MEQALAIARELGTRGDEAWILYDLAAVERNRNNLAGARAILELAIQLIEGPAGTGFFEDASCFHKALIPTSGERLMLQVRYS